MKSVIKENETKKEIKFPCLMIGKDTGFIVLFDKKGHGLVMNHNNFYDIGYYSNAWDMDSFEPFNGTIELSNN